MRIIHCKRARGRDWYFLRIDESDNTCRLSGTQWRALKRWMRDQTEGDLAGHGKDAVQRMYIKWELDGRDPDVRADLAGAVMEHIQFMDLLE